MDGSRDGKRAKLDHLPVVKGELSHEFTLNELGKRLSMLSDAKARIASAVEKWIDLEYGSHGDAAKQSSNRDRPDATSSNSVKRQKKRGREATDGQRRNERDAIEDEMIPPLKEVERVAESCRVPGIGVAEAIRWVLVLLADLQQIAKKLQLDDKDLVRVPAVERLLHLLSRLLRPNPHRITRPTHASTIAASSPATGPTPSPPAAESLPKASEAGLSVLGAMSRSSTAGVETGGGGGGGGEEGDDEGRDRQQDGELDMLRMDEDLPSAFWTPADSITDTSTGPQAQGTATEAPNPPRPPSTLRDAAGQLAPGEARASEPASESESESRLGWVLRAGLPDSADVAAVVALLESGCPSLAAVCGSNDSQDGERPVALDWVLVWLAELHRDLISSAVVAAHLVQPEGVQVHSLMLHMAHRYPDAAATGVARVFERILAHVTTATTPPVVTADDLLVLAESCPALVGPTVPLLLDLLPVANLPISLPLSASPERLASVLLTNLLPLQCDAHRVLVLLLKLVCTGSATALDVLLPVLSKIAADVAAHVSAQSPWSRGPSSPPSTSTTTTTAPHIATQLLNSLSSTPSARRSFSSPPAQHHRKDINIKDSNPKDAPGWPSPPATSPPTLPGLKFIQGVGVMSSFPSTHTLPTLIPLLFSSLSLTQVPAALVTAVLAPLGLVSGPQLAPHLLSEWLMAGLDDSARRPARNMDLSKRDGDAQQKQQGQGRVVEGDGEEEAIGRKKREALGQLRMAFEAHMGALPTATFVELVLRSLANGTGHEVPAVLTLLHDLLDDTLRENASVPCPALRSLLISCPPLLRRLPSLPPSSQLPVLRLLLACSRSITRHPAPSRSAKTGATASPTPTGASPPSLRVDLKLRRALESIGVTAALVFLALLKRDRTHQLNQILALVHDLVVVLASSSPYLLNSILSLVLDVCLSPYADDTLRPFLHPQHHLPVNQPALRPSSSLLSALVSGSDQPPYLSCDNYPNPFAWSAALYATLADDKPAPSARTPLAGVALAPDLLQEVLGRRVGGLGGSAELFKAWQQPARSRGGGGGLGDALGVKQKRAQTSTAVAEHVVALNTQRVIGLITACLTANGQLCGDELCSRLQLLANHLLSRLTSFEPTPTNQQYQETLPKRPCFPRDLFIRDVFRSNPLLLHLFHILSHHPLVFARCFDVVRSLLADTIGQWHTELRTDPRSAPQWHQTLALFDMITRAQWLPSPLSLCAEIFPLITPADITSLCITIWNFLRECPPSSSRSSYTTSPSSPTRSLLCRSPSPSTPTTPPLCDPCITSTCSTTTTTPSSRLPNSNSNMDMDANASGPEEAPSTPNAAAAESTSLTTPPTPVPPTHTGAVTPVLPPSSVSTSVGMEGAGAVAGGGGESWGPSALAGLDCGDGAHTDARDRRSSEYLLRVFPSEVVANYVGPLKRVFHKHIDVLVPLYVRFFSTG